MEHHESNFTSKNGYSVYYQYWRPEGTPPKAVVQISHGICEHSGRYVNVVNHLVPAGFAVYSNDHHGHGKTDGTRMYVEKFQNIIDDLLQMNEIIREKEGDIPIFLLGHSMGATISILYSEQHQETLTGLILSGCGLRVGEKINPMIISLSAILSKFLPKLKIDPKIDPETISHDPDTITAYKNDPLIYYKKVTARFGKELLDAYKKLPESATKIKIPVLMQSGGEDKIVHGTKDLYGLFETKDIDLKIYEGYYHEIYNETPEMRVKPLKDLQEWLEKHL
ncbi:MAG: lysophospholipase [Candidatus Hodarchaeales archaeon]